MSPTTCVKPWPGACRSLRRREHRAEEQHEAVRILVVRADRLRDEVERIAADHRHRARAVEHEAVRARRRASRARSGARRRCRSCSSNRRMNGPIAHDALLSLALPSSSALRPSKSRRLTSLPSVAPTVSPRLLTASTISGSGLFHSDFGMDADVGAGADRRHRLRLGEDLGVRTDADLEVLRPRALRDQRVLEPRRLGRAGRTRDRSSPMIATIDAAHAPRPSPDRRAPAPRSRARACSTTNVTPAALIACRSQGARNHGARASRLVRCRVGEHVGGRADARQRAGARGSPPPDRRRSRSSLIVGATRDRSNTPSAVTRTSAGPRDARAASAADEQRASRDRRAGCRGTVRRLPIALMRTFACAKMRADYSLRAATASQFCGILRAARASAEPPGPSNGGRAMALVPLDRVRRRVARRARRLRRHHGDAQGRLDQQLLEGARERSGDAAARLGSGEGR